MKNLSKNSTGRISLYDGFDYNDAVDFLCSPENENISVIYFKGKSFSATKEHEVQEVINHISSCNKKLQINFLSDIYKFKKASENSKASDNSFLSFMNFADTALNNYCEINKSEVIISKYTKNDNFTVIKSATNSRNIQKFRNIRNIRKLQTKIIKDISKDDILEQS